MLNRRSFALAAAASFVGGCNAMSGVRSMQDVTEVKNDPLSLRAVGRSKGLEIGSAFSGSDDRTYRSLLAKHCDLIVPEWQMKPREVKPTEKGPYRFEHADRIARFAREKGLALHGHTLFWHEEPLSWAESDDYEQVKRAYGGFLQRMVGRYPQAVSWDVFSELIDEDRPFRDQFLIRKYGLQFIDFCFRTVHEHAPNAQLVINEYNLECANDWCTRKQANMLSLLDRLKRMKTPIHAVGVQSHLSTVHRASASQALALIDRAADLGVATFLSELDVNDSTMSRDVAVRDKEVADYYEDFLTPVLQNSAVKRVVFWGISDFDNWIVRGQTEEKRRAGAPRPALFDKGNQPKPAFHAVVRALEAAPRRAPVLS